MPDYCVETRLSTHMLAQTFIHTRATVYRLGVKHIGNLNLPMPAATPRKLMGIVRLAQTKKEKRITRRQDLEPT